MVFERNEAQNVYYGLGFFSFLFGMFIMLGGLVGFAILLGVNII